MTPITEQRLNDFKINWGYIVRRSQYKSEKVIISYICEKNQTKHWSWRRMKDVNGALTDIGFKFDIYSERAKNQRRYEQTDWRHYRPGGLPGCWRHKLDLRGLMIEVGDGEVLCVLPSQGTGVPEGCQSLSVGKETHHQQRKRNSLVLLKVLYVTRYFMFRACIVDRCGDSWWPWVLLTRWQSLFTVWRGGDHGPGGTQGCQSRVHWQGGQGVSLKQCTLRPLWVQAAWQESVRWIKGWGAVTPTLT